MITETIEVSGTTNLARYVWLFSLFGWRLFYVCGDWFPAHYLHGLS